MSILRTRSRLFEVKSSWALGKHNGFTLKRFVKNNPNKMIELEFATYKLFCSYCVPVAMHDKTTNEYFRTDMDNKVVNHDIDKWLKGAEATQKPQQFFANKLNPERYPQ